MFYISFIYYFFPSSTTSSCRSPHRGPFHVSLSEVQRMGLLHVVWEREDVGILQSTLNMELCSGWMEFPRAVLGMGSPSHRASSGVAVKRTPSSLVQPGGGWRQVTKPQIFFSKIFWLKLVSCPAVMNTSSQDK